MRYVTAMIQSLFNFVKSVCEWEWNREKETKCKVHNIENSFISRPIVRYEAFYR